MLEVHIHGLKEPVVLVATAAVVVPIPGLKEPVLGLKELVVLVAASAAAGAGAPAGSSISDKITDQSVKCIPNKAKQGMKVISYNWKKYVYYSTTEKSNLALDSSSIL